MVYLILAFCSSALVGIVMRLSEGRANRSLGMLTVNYIVCALLAALDCTGGLLPQGEGLPGALAMGVINGCLYLGGFLLLRYNVSRNGVVLSSTFMKLGLLVTMVISIVLFGEQPGAIQIAGFALAVAAIVLINSPGRRQAKGLGPELLLLMATGGFCDGMSKIFEELGNPALAGQFLFYTFLVALVLCGALAGVKRQLPGLWEWLFGAAIGIPNFYSCKFLLWSLRTVPGVVAYPVYSVAGILLATVAGVVLFREKLRSHQWAALGMILLSLVLLNV